MRTETSVKSFEHFLQTAAGESGCVNGLFEEGRYQLLTLLERIAVLLAHRGIPYTTVGGMAVMVHVERVDGSAIRNTKNVDVMIRRSDRQQVIDAAERHLGFVFRHDPTSAVHYESMNVHGMAV